MQMIAAISTTLVAMRTIVTNRRLKGERRWGLGFEFPMRDCGGILVISDRRKLPDRRLDNTTLEQRLLMFSGAIPVGPEGSRH
jgi:hypothetical protein